MVNSFGVLLDVTVITKSLQEIIKILHEKMFEAINSY